jgi:hypothetical protein
MTAQTWSSEGYAKNARFDAVFGHAANPWYFPTVEDYAGKLAAAGFDVRYIALIPRPTPLPGDVIEWLTTFCGCGLRHT